MPRYYNGKNRKNPLWTPQEDELVLSYQPVPGREHKSCIARRSVLKRGFAERVPITYWTAADVAKLRRTFPLSDRKDTLVDHFRNEDGSRRYTPTQIRSKVGHLKIRRKYLGDPKIPLDGHFELLDQILIRAREDRIGLLKLGQACGVGRYFEERWRRQKNVSLKAVARAVEFFGAKLVIDWCDR